MEVCFAKSLPQDVCGRVVSKKSHAHHATDAAHRVTHFYTPSILREALFLLSPDYEFFDLPTPKWTTCVLEPERDDCLSPEELDHGGHPFRSRARDTLYRRGDGAVFYKTELGQWLYVDRYAPFHYADDPTRAHPSHPYGPSPFCVCSVGPMHVQRWGSRGSAEHGPGPFLRSATRRN